MTQDEPVGLHRESGCKMPNQRLRHSCIHQQILKDRKQRGPFHSYAPGKNVRVCRKTKKPQRMKIICAGMHMQGVQVNGKIPSTQQYHSAKTGISHADVMESVNDRKGAHASLYNSFRRDTFIFSASICSVVCFPSDLSTQYNTLRERA